MPPFHRLTAVFCLAAAQAVADPVNIRPDMPSVTVETPEGPVEISRIQDNTNELWGTWSQTSRPCPPFCIQPISPAPGVTTIGELELLDFLEKNEGILIDSRTYDWYAGGTIPGAVNIPYDVVVDRLGELGCEADFDGWDCTGAQRVALFCNGVWCGQSPTAIRNMIGEGYPAERILYYRGGMQMWRMLGLTVTGDDS